MIAFWLANPVIYLFEPVDGPAGSLHIPKADCVFCPCMFEPQSWACRRKRMQGKAPRQLPQQLRCTTAHRPNAARHTHAAGSRSRPTSGNSGDDDGGGAGPPLTSPTAGYDRDLELKLAERIVTAIAEASKVDGVLVLRPAEVTAALIANLGFVLAREPAAVAEPEALARTLAAIERRLLSHIASALRVATRSEGRAAQ